MSSPVRTPGVYYRIASESWLPAVLDHLYDNFWPDEVISKTHGVYDGKNRLEASDAGIEKRLKQNLSVVALKEGTTEIVGVVVCEAVRIEDYLKERPAEDSGPFFYHVFVLNELKKMLRGALTNGDEEFYFVSHLSADKNWRGKGVASGGLRVACDVAKALGFRLVLSEASGIFSRRAMEAAGLRCEEEVLYDELEYEGKKLFEKLDKSLHPSCSAMLKKI